MADDKYTFGTARIRLEEIVTEVRKKDTSLEKSLDLLEEGVRLANICTELVDHTDMSVQAVVETNEGEAVAEATEPDADVVTESGTESGAEPDSEPDVDTGFDEAYDDEDEPSDAASAE
ncbi:MAG: exodeoxyribonuclease VII small subunit [Coriobacteriia bacterium]|nr:exodeoxyribonuclease VII small subunit [Coriobacteriia bacterium]MBN2840629.1 exodeoxyribonuclease VII small subunit [Coriobacteriia bacterium]